MRRCRFARFDLQIDRYRYRRLASLSAGLSAELSAVALVGLLADLWVELLAAALAESSVELLAVASAGLWVEL